MTDADILINYANAVNKYNLAKAWAAQYAAVAGKLNIEWLGANSCAGYNEVRKALEKTINKDVVKLINNAIENELGSEVDTLAIDAAEAMARLAK